MVQKNLKKSIMLMISRKFILYNNNFEKILKTDYKNYYSVNNQENVFFCFK